MKFYKRQTPEKEKLLVGSEHAQVPELDRALSITETISKSKTNQKEGSLQQLCIVSEYVTLQHLYLMDLYLSFKQI